MSDRHRRLSGRRRNFELETLIDPRDHFSSVNTPIHGISSDHVRGKPSYGDVHAVVDGHLAARFTFAHSYFDKGALGAACRVRDLAPIETKWPDSVRVAKRAWPHLESHRLNVLTEYLGIRHKHHDALNDALAAGQVIVRAIEHTGIELAGWLTPTNARVGLAPKLAPIGPLRGQRIAILGRPVVAYLGQSLAAAGGRIVSSVGVTTTMLVISQDQPFGK